jgi:tetratricopeptide (TPR) repeat protein
LAAPEDEAAEPDFAGAEAKLAEIGAMKNLSPDEQAQMYNFYGFIYYSQEKYQKSIGAYEKVLALPDIYPGLRNQVTYTLAQLKFTTEQYQDAIDLLKDWLKTQENPGPEPYILIATGYYQLEQIDKIIPPVETALQIAKERGIDPKEQWWLLLRVAYWEKGDNKKVKDILEILITNWPKKEYWVQLSAIFGELENEPKQLSAFESAYDQNMLATNSELLQMAQLYLANDVPYKAAKVLEKGFSEKIVERNARNLRLYSQAWQLAREDRRAIEPLKEAAEMSANTNNVSVRPAKVCGRAI